MKYVCCSQFNCFLPLGHFWKRSCGLEVFQGLLFGSCIQSAIMPYVLWVSKFVDLWISKWVLSARFVSKSIRSCIKSAIWSLKLLIWCFLHKDGLIGAATNGRDRRSNKWTVDDKTELTSFPLRPSAAQHFVCPPINPVSLQWNRFAFQMWLCWLFDIWQI